MNKTPEPDDTSDVSATPVIPGTELPRSLGDMMREAADVQSADVVDSSLVEPAPAAVTQAAAKPAKPKKVSRSQARRFARERALQALYQWDVSQGQASDVRQQFVADQDMSRVDIDYFTKVFKGVSHNPQPIDDALADALDRPIKDLDPVERAVLRIAAFELTQCLDIPARVVINEGIEITKRFGADKGHRYVNGVLDKLAASVRPLEMQRK